MLRVNSFFLQDIVDLLCGALVTSAEAETSSSFVPLDEVAAVQSHSLQSAEWDIRHHKFVRHSTKMAHRPSAASSPFA